MATVYEEWRKSKYFIHWSDEVLKNYISRWQGIKYRCLNISSVDFKYYGLRGRGIWEPWANDFLLFGLYIETLKGFADLSLQLDRINNAGSYEPENIRLVTLTINVHNTDCSTCVSSNFVKALPRIITYKKEPKIKKPKIKKPKIKEEKIKKPKIKKTGICLNEQSSYLIYKNWTR